MVSIKDGNASLVAQTVKRLPAMQETRVLSLGWEDPLEKEMAIHSSILAWKIRRTEEPGRLQSWWWCSQSLNHVQLCDPMDCSPAGSSVHGISEARILEWVTISFSRGSSPPTD